MIAATSARARPTPRRSPPPPRCGPLAARTRPAGDGWRRAREPGGAVLTAGSGSRPRPGRRRTGGRGSPGRSRRPCASPMSGLPEGALWREDQEKEKAPYHRRQPDARVGDQLEQRAATEPAQADHHPKRKADQGRDHGGDGCDLDCEPDRLPMYWFPWNMRGTAGLSSSQSSRTGSSPRETGRRELLKHGEQPISTRIRASRTIPSANAGGIVRNGRAGRRALASVWSAPSVAADEDDGTDLRQRGSQCCDDPCDHADLAPRNARSRAGAARPEHPRLREQPRGNALHRGCRERHNEGKREQRLGDVDGSECEQEPYSTEDAPLHQQHHHEDADQDRGDPQCDVRKDVQGTAPAEAAQPECEPGRQAEHHGQKVETSAIRIVTSATCCTSPPEIQMSGQAAWSWCQM